jgi:DedD protein
MDLRAKQRLTGAVILVALVVLLVPELLTGPGDTTPAATAKGDEGLREYTIDIEGRNAPVTLPPPQESAVNLPAPQTPPAADPGRALPGESAAPAPREPEPARATATPNPMSVAPAAAPSVAAPARVEPPRSEPAAVPVPRAERGSFVVQLGTFGSRANADRLARDMKARGFSAFVVPVASNGRELFRVRVGPTRDRASAESLAAELKRAGQSGSIVPIS